MGTIISELHDAKEYGSILTVTPQDWSALYARFAEIEEDIHISREAALRELLPLVQVAEALAQKYNAVVTNPPYMGSLLYSKGSLFVRLPSITELKRAERRILFSFAILMKSNRRSMFCFN